MINQRISVDHWRTKMLFQLLNVWVYRHNYNGFIFISIKPKLQPKQSPQKQWFSGKKTDGLQTALDDKFSTRMHFLV